MASKTDYVSEVPVDYPCESRPIALTGAQAKIALVIEDGKYYQPGDAPSERRLAWLFSESLVEQFTEKCLESKSGKRAEMSEIEIIAQYVDRAIAAEGFGTPAQVRWTFRKVARLLGWPIPENCQQL